MNSGNHIEYQYLYFNNMKISKCISMLKILPIIILFFIPGVQPSTQQSIENLDVELAGVEWVNLPRYPGDVGVLKAVLYVEDVFVNVKVWVKPLCGFVQPLDERYYAVVDVKSIEALIRVRVDRLGVECPVLVVFDPKYRYVGTYINEEPYYFKASLYIPPYPDIRVEEVLGHALLGIPSRVVLNVSIPIGVGGMLDIRGVGLEVLSPSTPIRVGGPGGQIELVILPKSLTAKLVLEFSSRDWLGNQVRLIREAPIEVLDHGGLVVFVEPSHLAFNAENLVNITVRLPVDANGTVKISASGALVVGDASFPVVNGVGSAFIRLVTMSRTVRLDVSVSFRYNDYWASMSRTITLRASATPGMAHMTVRPTRLIIGAANNVSIAISAPGRFTAELYVEGAATGVQMPMVVRDCTRPS